MVQSDTHPSGWRLTLWRRKPAERLEPPLPALAPYRPLTRSRAKRAFGLTALLLFCFIYGFYFSILPPNFLPSLLIPIVMIALLVIWALPDANWAPTRALEWLFYAMFISLIVWPDYLAIALPGLPWITLLRVTSFPLFFVLLICASISAEFRSRIACSLKFISSIPILLVIFVTIQLISIGFSADVATSVQKFILAQTTWTSIFFVSAYIFLEPGQIRRWSSLLWAMAVFVSFIAIWEFQIGRLPWAGHIPGFLKIEDDSVQRILAGSMRAGTTRYRTQATFGTPLGLAEFVALTLPFVLHFTSARFAPRIRLAALVSVPILLIGCYLTDAKLGMVGCLLDVLLYVFAATLHNWKRNKESIFAATILYSYPAGLCAIVTALLFVQRFKVLILGDSSHNPSTDARFAQYAMGLQKILQWPFGYGIGMGGETLGFGRDLSGMITIDTYYLSVALEYGILGFIVYFGMFATAIYEAGKRSVPVSSNNDDRSFLLPITISLISFIVMKSVFSQQDNHPVIFMMLGAIGALGAASRGNFATRTTRAPGTIGYVGWRSSIRP